MSTTPKQVLRTYVTLTLLATFASSFIWGINTLFLLDAGLSITAAFAANAFFTLGQVLFEVPTGVVADTVGRRMSYLLGSATLFGSTLFYLLLWHTHAAFWLWALASILLGLGFTFFSGATEAWLVDALHFTKYKGTLESAFAKGQVASGIAMLTGTVAGGVIAQATNLGVPYILRSAVLGLTFIVAFLLMKDLGFTPRKSTSIHKEANAILKSSLKHGLGNRPVRWIMLSAPFTAGVSFYGFYAMQPYLLQLYGHSNSYSIAGLAAAIVAAAQICGGLLVPRFRKIFSRRTTLLLTASGLSTLVLLIIGLLPHFWIVITLFSAWGILFAATMPVRQAFINGLIPSEQRATVLSSDNLITSAGAAVTQPVLGKAADVWSYSVSFVASAGISVLALPFVFLARREKAKSDPLDFDGMNMQATTEPIPAAMPVESKSQK
jgi:MFS family permease